MRRTVLLWLHGLVSAAIGGFASGIVLVVGDPSHFNFDDGWTRLWRMSLLFGVAGAGLYLKQSPLWKLPKDEPEDEA